MTGLLLKTYFPELHRGWICAGKRENRTLLLNLQLCESANGCLKTTYKVCLFDRLLDQWKKVVKIAPRDLAHGGGVVELNARL